MNFSQALIELKAGEKLRRPSWLGSVQWVELDKKRGYFIAFYPPRDDYPKGQFIGYTMSADDIVVAEDWEVHRE